MEEPTTRFRLVYTEDERRNIVLKNIIKMLTARGLIDEKQTDYLQDLIKSGTDDLIYTVKLLQKSPDKSEILGFTTYAVKFYLQKISSLSSATPIVDFMDAYKDAHRIIIVSEIAEKTYNELVEKETTEIFYEYELMMCIIENELVPVHEVLTTEEAKNVLKSYNCKKTELKRINSTDPVARFYHLEPGMCVRIISPSEIGGKYVSYRVVKKSSLFTKGR